MNFRKIWYLPLESYKARYTFQWSAPKTGWLERRWVENSIPYERIDPADTIEEREIKVGSVVDGVGRSIFAFKQVQELLLRAEKGEISSEDVIYIDDFWLPGFEALAYNFELMGIEPRIYAFLHAQSVDRFDFTYPMRSWMRDTERSWGKYMAGIFVCGETLKELVVTGGIAPEEKVHVTGHPYCAEEVYTHTPYRIDTLPAKENTVVYSSRWDSEKNPEVFLTLAEMSYELGLDLRFEVCTGAKKLKSNNPSLLRLLYEKLQSLDNLTLHEGLEKSEYYEHLAKAKFQFNCASQDFVAISLLEATTFGCYPVYPNYRSFPETFEYKQEFMYRHLDPGSALDLIVSKLESRYYDHWSDQAYEDRAWIHNRFTDVAWRKMLHVMNYNTGVASPYLTQS